MLLSTLLFATAALAHAVSGSDQAYIQTTTGPQVAAFLYLGAKHMVTGYDHLLFLFGVIFFLYRMKDVAVYVTLFALGHSITLIAGVLSGTHVSTYAVDAIIGLSVVYKALDNLDAFPRWLGFQPNTKVVVLIFGLFHGLGLATKLRRLSLSPDGMLVNLISFNVGVEIGQLLALAAMLIAMGYWRRTSSFTRNAINTNVALMIAGFVLVVYQFYAYFTL